MPQEVCEGDAYIDRFIVSTGTATVDANSTRAFRARGILSVQGRCSNGRQLGYYGPLPSDTSVAYDVENIAVSRVAHNQGNALQAPPHQGLEMLWQGRAASRPVQQQHP